MKPLHEAINEMLESAEHKGRHDFLNKVIDNPYTEISDLGLAWNRGWLAEAGVPTNPREYRQWVAAEATMNNIAKSAQQLVRLINEQGEEEPIGDIQVFAALGLMIDLIEADRMGRIKLPE